MSHTPGPWITDDAQDGDKYRYVMPSGDAGPYYIARLPLYPNACEREADARLIAAAPELLAALKDMVSWPDAEVEPPHRELYEKHRAAALAAIAKAEGK